MRDITVGTSFLNIQSVNQISRNGFIILCRTKVKVHLIFVVEQQELLK